jgi:hypothetical protein
VPRITPSKNKQRNIWDAKRELADVKKRKAHAIRVVWRIIQTWVKAQLALVDINMVTIPQVFLPYAIMQDGRALAEHAESNPGFLLGDGN